MIVKYMWKKWDFSQVSVRVDFHQTITILSHEFAFLQSVTRLRIASSPRPKLPCLVPSRSRVLSEREDPNLVSALSRARSFLACAQRCYRDHSCTHRKTPGVG